MIAYFDLEFTERHWLFWKRKRSVRYPLSHIPMTEMDELLEDESKALIIGYPIRFDSLRRVWPKPSSNIMVIFAQWVKQ